ncbi:unnamed protein product [Larinioides sclopetarius]|uniref:Uncharacterized protein n=1 Tax=Larinioides sclopetarius TaxID=280406 RepID=A0AAV2BY27_9ARAC
MLACRIEGLPIPMWRDIPTQPDCMVEGIIHMDTATQPLGAISEKIQHGQSTMDYRMLETGIIITAKNIFVITFN